VQSKSIVGALVVSGTLSGCPDPDPGDEGLRPASWRTALDADDSIGAFLSVWGASADDVWAVGGQVDALGDRGTGAAYRRQAGAWAAADLPADAPLLNWVHGTASRLWIVGNAGAAYYREGEAWTTTETGTDAPLWGCWAVADDDVWAVGGDALNPDADPVIVHFDGTAWSDHALPELDRDANAMFKVWAAAADDVWVVGDSGVILHFDGQAWAQTPSGTGADLISLWGTGPDNVVAVGGRSIGTIARWNGTAWSVEEVGRIPGINGVWMDERGDAALAGNDGAAALLYAPAFETELEESGAGIMVLHGIYGFDNGERISVGGSLNRSPPYFGIIVETD